MGLWVLGLEGNVETIGQRAPRLLVLPAPSALPLAKAVLEQLPCRRVTADSGAVYPLE